MGLEEIVVGCGKRWPQGTAGVWGGGGRGREQEPGEVRGLRAGVGALEEGPGRLGAWRAGSGRRLGAETHGPRVEAGHALMQSPVDRQTHAREQRLPCRAPWPRPLTLRPESLLRSCSLTSPTPAGSSRTSRSFARASAPARPPGCLPPARRPRACRPAEPPPRLSLLLPASVPPPRTALVSHLSLCISASRACQERSSSLGLWVLVNPWLCLVPCLRHRLSIPLRCLWLFSVLLGTWVGGFWERRFSPISHPRGKGNGGSCFCCSGPS